MTPRCNTHPDRHAINSDGEFKCAECDAKGEGRKPDHLAISMAQRVLLREAEQLRGEILHRCVTEPGQDERIDEIWQRNMTRSKQLTTVAYWLACDGLYTVDACGKVDKL